MTELVARALETVPEPWPPAGAERACTNTSAGHVRRRIMAPT